MSEEKPKTLQERLEAARARSAAASRREEDTSLLVEVEAEECAAELAEKHGASKVKVLSTVVGPVVLLRPPGLAYEVFRKAVLKAGNRELPDKDRDKFVDPAIKYPENFQDLLDEAPAVRDEIAVVLGSMFGNKVREDMGK